jgi:hypothetical protein
MVDDRKSKSATKQVIDSLLADHRGKRVVTGWSSRGTSSWMWVGLGNGVAGVIDGWDADGPRVRVDDADAKDSVVPSFFPGSAKSSTWGEGRTWRFVDG